MIVQTQLIIIINIYGYDSTEAIWDSTSADYEATEVVLKIKKKRINV